MQFFVVILAAILTAPRTLAGSIGYVGPLHHQQQQQQQQYDGGYVVALGGSGHGLSAGGGEDDDGHFGGNEIGGHGGEEVNYHDHPVYHYDYAVHDLHTHDVKSQWETRNGDVVKGEYTILEPDGTRRIVSYTADKHNGFNAVVKHVKD